MTDENNLRAVGDRIESLLQEIGAVGDRRMRDKAEEAVRLLMEFYGAGLGRILEIVDQDGAAERLFDRFADDGLVATLLILHELHPIDVETRIQRALDRVRPYLGSHGGDVQFVGVTNGVVQLRLEGSCQGCASSTVTMQLAIEKAVEEAAPEVTRIEVEGMSGSVPAPALLQIESAGAGGWMALDASPELGPDEFTAVEVEGMKVIVCRVGETLYAYRDFCPACGAAFDGGMLREAILACPSCEHRYNVRHAGRSVSAHEFHLEPLPLLRERGRVRIAVPAGSRS